MEKRKDTSICYDVLTATGRDERALVRDGGDAAEKGNSAENRPITGSARRPGQKMTNEQKDRRRQKSTLNSSRQKGVVAHSIRGGTRGGSEDSRKKDLVRKERTDSVRHLEEG